MSSIYVAAHLGGQPLTLGLILPRRTNGFIGILDALDDSDVVLGSAITLLEPLEQHE